MINNIVETQTHPQKKRSADIFYINNCRRIALVPRQMLHRCCKISTAALKFLRTHYSQIHAYYLTKITTQLVWCNNSTENSHTLIYWHKYCQRKSSSILINLDENGKFNTWMEEDNIACQGIADMWYCLGMSRKAEKSVQSAIKRMKTKAWLKSFGRQKGHIIQ